MPQESTPAINPSIRLSAELQLWASGGAFRGGEPLSTTVAAALGVTPFILTLLNDPDATAALATLGIVTGTWTPTLTNVSNVASFTAQVGQYIRVGDTVICMCSEGVDPTLAAPTATLFRMSLPVASNFAATLDAVGLSSSRISGGGGISANAATDDVTVLYNAVITTIDFINCFFMYKVI